MTRCRVRWSSRRPRTRWGLRAIDGAEVSLADGRHLTLLVRSAAGWRNLCRLLTLTHARGRSAIVASHRCRTIIEAQIASSLNRVGSACDGRVRAQRAQRNP